jgi:hypothetical protein
MEFGDGTDTAHGGNDTCGLVAENAAGRFTSADRSLLCAAHSCGEAFRSQLCIAQMWQMITNEPASVCTSSLNLAVWINKNKRSSSWCTSILNRHHNNGALWLLFKSLAQSIKD